MSLALVAQVTEPPAADINEVVDAIVNPWLAALSLILPIVLGLIMHATSAKAAKRLIAVIGAVVVMIIANIAQPPEAWTFPMIVAQVSFLSLVANRAYWVFDGIASRMSPGGLNELLPGGARFGEAFDAVKDLAERVNLLEGKN